MRASEGLGGCDDGGTRLVFENFDEGIKHSSVVFGAPADPAQLQASLDDICGVNDARGATASKAGVDVAGQE